MRVQKLIGLMLIALSGCGFPSTQANYNGAISFDDDTNFPFFIQVYNNDLGTGKTNNQIAVDITADRTWLTPGDTFRRVILSGSNANCTARDYLRGKLESDRKGSCDFPNGRFEEIVNGKKTGKTIQIKFDPTVRDGEQERLNAALRSR